MYKRQDLAKHVDSSVSTVRRDLTVLEAAGNLKRTHGGAPVSYTHLRAHETVLDIVCRLLLEKKKKTHSKHLCNDHIPEPIEPYRRGAYSTPRTPSHSVD